MTPLKVEIFSSPGCTKCLQAKEYLLQFMQHYGEAIVHVSELNVIDNLDYAVQLGVLTTPAIAINGKLCFTGLPSLKQLQTHLEKIVTIDF